MQQSFATTQEHQQHVNASQIVRDNLKVGCRRLAGVCVLLQKVFGSIPELNSRIREFRSSGRRLNGVRFDVPMAFTDSAG